MPSMRLESRMHCDQTNAHEFELLQDTAVNAGVYAWHSGAGH